MRQHFYAYHGPSNNTDFDPSGGYGVSQEYKQKQTKVGDLVYVIQKRRERNYYELCGTYKVVGHYHQEMSKRPYRVRLIEVNPISQRIVIDEAECSRRLPLLDGDERWSNFQRHFCRQGVSLQSPLKSQVVAVLDELICQYSESAFGTIVELAEMEAKFSEEVDKAILSSSTERLKRLSQANRLPCSVRVSTKVFLRNPDVVAEVLYRARGVCEKCGEKAPFSRRTDGSPYLEVHHKVRLADDGEDTLDNAIAVCPNCHRELHFGV
ncbi:putative restriction endonuclease [Nitrincola nitratireducens]|uniref:Putative restriction endonuclease n=2 Tax=Nitrincola nitratireducens TaxID=1229521 RepID=W9UVJ8_9GAMM|nr:putative restriction endonuclease [Nitrincola nitratireducens]